MIPQKTRTDTTPRTHTSKRTDTTHRIHTSPCTLRALENLSRISQEFIQLELQLTTCKQQVEYLTCLPFRMSSNIRLDKFQGNGTPAGHKCMVYKIGNGQNFMICLIQELLTLLFFTYIYRRTCLV